MELYQIRTFLVVAQEQNLTRAAERLALSQPAVSGQIKSLESALGLALFERARGGMQLSPAGKALLEPAQALTAAASSLRAKASALSGQLTGRLKLGAVLHPDAIRLGPLVRTLQSRHPLVRLDIRHRNMLTVVSSLRSHELDASFYIGQDIPNDLGFVELRRLTYRVAAAPVWQARLASASWAEVARLPWILTPRGGSFAQLVESIFRPHGLELTNIVEADQELAIIRLVEAGVGLSLVRVEVAAEAARLGRMVTWEQGTAESLLRLLYLKSRGHEPLIGALRELAVEVISDAPQSIGRTT